MPHPHQHRSPCDQCAFRRDIKPGTLGGSGPEVYIGQTHGPFWIPCHRPKNYKGKGCMDAQDPTAEHAECAGSAIFRANNGRDDLMPAALLHLPADKETVFADYAEFLAHHGQIPLEVARKMLATITPAELLQMELRKNQAKQLLIAQKK